MLLALLPDRLLEEPLGLRVSAFGEATDRRAAHLDVPIRAGDRDQFVDRLAVAALGEDSDEALAERPVVEVVVEADQLGGRDAGLARRAKCALA